MAQPRWLPATPLIKVRAVAIGPVGCARIVFGSEKLRCCFLPALARWPPCCPNSRRERGGSGDWPLNKQDIIQVLFYLPRARPRTRARSSGKIGIGGQRQRKPARSPRGAARICEHNYADQADWEARGRANQIERRGVAGGGEKSEAIWPLLHLKSISSPPLRSVLFRWLFPFIYSTGQFHGKSLGGGAQSAGCE